MFTRGCIKCFMGTDLDALVTENFYLEKNMQDIGSEITKTNMWLVKYENYFSLILCL